MKQNLELSVQYLLLSSFSDLIFFSILPVAEDIINRSSKLKSSSMKSSAGFRGPITYRHNCTLIVASSILDINSEKKTQVATTQKQYLNNDNTTGLIVAVSVLDTDSKHQVAITQRQQLNNNQ